MNFNWHHSFKYSGKIIFIQISFYALYLLIILQRFKRKWDFYLILYQSCRNKFVQFIENGTCKRKRRGTRYTTLYYLEKKNWIKCWKWSESSELLNENCLLFINWADPWCNAIQGQPVEREKQASAYSPRFKNFDNLIAFHWKAIQRLTWIEQILHFWS